MRWKLTDLHAVLGKPPNWSQPQDRFFSSLMFDCPHCVATVKACPTCGHEPRRMKFFVPFWPPIDPDKLVERWQWPRWPEHKATRRDGDTLATISIVEYAELAGHGRYAITEGEVLDLG